MYVLNDDVCLCVGLSQMADPLQVPMDHQSQAAVPYVQQQDGGAQQKFRDSSQAPLRKLTVELIKTYRHINDVRVIISAHSHFEQEMMYVGGCVCVCEPMSLFPACAGILC